MNFSSPTVVSSFDGVVPNPMYNTDAAIPPMPVPTVDSLSYPLRFPYVRPVIAPPPPYTVGTSIGTALNPPPAYSTICREGGSEVDVDVVGITDDARDVRLSDDDEDQQKDQPLDLSLKRKGTQYTACCSSSTSCVQSRPSVIRNGYAGRNTDMRRSASSVTSRPNPEPDVSEHFRRSLSGKWPRRQANHSHYTSPQNDKEKFCNGSTAQRKTSQSSLLSPRRTPPSGVSPPLIIVNNSGIEIEDHFRKALGAEAYELLRRNRQMNLA